MMSQKTDEDEHSIEMQLAYIAKVMERCLQINKFQVTIFENNFKTMCFDNKSKKDNYKIVPIMVGNVNSDKERMYGQLLAPYFLKPNVLFVISSDFCHWGWFKQTSKFTHF
jgi:predicted class III extradiol MEMO1 family dioxygenase